jgi:hypothetical protein
MADAILYRHPSEQVTLTVDFQDVLPTTDSTLNNIGSGSTISATKSDGSDASAVLFAATRTSKVLTCILKNLTDGEEYTVTFLGQGTTSTERFVKTYLVLVRKSLTGEF